MRKEFIGWTAGIIDGEGCIGAYRNGRGKKKRPLLQVGNTDLKILHILQKHWGGIIYECTRKDRPKSKRIWTWRLYGEKLYELLFIVSPLLISKKERAKKVMGYR